MAREHLRAFAGLPDVALEGIYSRTPAKGRALADAFKLPHVAASVEELFARTQAALVIVAVPELAARAVAEQCFAFPWAVLLEKPPGYSLADASAIASAAQARQRRVFVALNRRFLSSTHAALEDLETRQDPRFIHVADQQDLALAATLGHPPEVVRHWMFANSIHVIDLLRCFGRGHVSQVQPITAWNPKTPGTVLARIQFASGDSGLYEGIWNGPGPWSATVTTASRRWELRPLEQAAFQNAQERKLNPIPVDAWDREYKPGLRRQAHAVIEALRGNPSRAVTLSDALETMRLIHSIFGL